MKIIHQVRATGEEVDSLFNPLMLGCVASYGTVEEQAVAISAAKLEFETMLNGLLEEAVKVGKKLGKKGADKGDDEMYGLAGVVPSVV